MNINELAEMLTWMVVIAAVSLWILEINQKC